MLVFRQGTKADIRIALLLSLAEVVQEVVQPVLAASRGRIAVPRLPRRPLPQSIIASLLPGHRLPACWSVAYLTRWQKVCEHIGETIKTRAGSPIRCK